MDAGFPMRLVNTTRVKQYDGIKHTNDFTDATYLAHLMRLGILPQGYIYPKEARVQRREQPQVRQRVPELGLCRGSPLRHPPLRRGAALLSAQEGQGQRHRRPQGGGP
jgi:hypothetical protein